LQYRPDDRINNAVEGTGPVLRAVSRDSSKTKKEKKKTSEEDRNVKKDYLTEAVEKSSHKSDQVSVEEINAMDPMLTMQKKTANRRKKRKKKAIGIIQLLAPAQRKRKKASLEETRSLKSLKKKTKGERSTISKTSPDLTNLKKYRGL